MNGMRSVTVCLLAGVLLPAMVTGQPHDEVLRALTVRLSRTEESGVTLSSDGTDTVLWRSPIRRLSQDGDCESGQPLPVRSSWAPEMLEEGESLAWCPPDNDTGASVTVDLEIDGFTLGPSQGTRASQDTVPLGGSRGGDTGRLTLLRPELWEAAGLAALEGEWRVSLYAGPQGGNCCTGIVIGDSDGWAFREPGTIPDDATGVLPLGTLRIGTVDGVEACGVLSDSSDLWIECPDGITVDEPLALLLFPRPEASALGAGGGLVRLRHVAVDRPRPDPPPERTDPTDAVVRPTAWAAGGFVAGALLMGLVLLGLRRRGGQTVQTSDVDRLKQLVAFEGKVRAAVKPVLDRLVRLEKRLERKTTDDATQTHEDGQSGGAQPQDDGVEVSEPAASEPAETRLPTVPPTLTRRYETLHRSESLRRWFGDRFSRAEVGEAVDVLLRLSLTSQLLRSQLRRFRGSDCAQMRYWEEIEGEAQKFANGLGTFRRRLQSGDLLSAVPTESERVAAWPMVPEWPEGQSVELDDHRLAEAERHATRVLIDRLLVPLARLEQELLEAFPQEATPDEITHAGPILLAWAGSEKLVPASATENLARLLGFTYRRIAIYGTDFGAVSSLLDERELENARNEHPWSSWLGARPVPTTKTGLVVARVRYPLLHAEQGSLGPKVLFVRF